MIYELRERTNRKGKKVMHYPKAYGRFRKQEKRAMADTYQERWAKLSLEQKFNELDKRPGNCTKERERLGKGIKT